MSKITALDSDSANMNNLPLGYYYYYIPYNNLEYGKYLGVCSAIESLTYNPFLTDENVTYLETTYDNSRYGNINSGSCTVKRIMSCSQIELELTNSIVPAPVSEQKGSEVLFDVMYNGFALPLFNQMKSDGVNMDNLKQCQFDDFLSLAYNGGLVAVTGSPMYQTFLTNPEDSSIPTNWVSWYTNGGLAGLVARRQAEADIYVNGNYDYRAIAQVDSSGSITGIAVSDNNGHGYIPSSCKGDV